MLVLGDEGFETVALPRRGLSLERVLILNFDGCVVGNPGWTGVLRGRGLVEFFFFFFFKEGWWNSWGLYW